MNLVSFYFTKNLLREAVQGAFDKPLIRIPFASRAPESSFFPADN